MHNQTKEESQPNHDQSLSVYKTISLTIQFLEALIGILINGFMVAVNLIDLRVQGHLGSCDSILTCLGISRFCLQFMMLTLYILSYFFSTYATSDSVTNGFTYSYLFFNNTCLWFATWLCTFYCVRIVSSQQRLFVTIKTHFDRLVPALLVSALVISYLSTALFSSNKSMFGNWSFNSHGSKNNTDPFAFSGTDLVIWSSLCILGSTPPFVIFCTTAWLVIHSLLKHTRKMKSQERTGFREPSLKAHYGAIKTMFHFFLFYLLYMVAINIRMSGTLKDDSWTGCFCAVVLGAYPSIHSGFLVNGNSKLRQSFIRLLHKGNCYLQTSKTEIPEM
ncbi:taste receptor type 2 member 40-like [Bombina bombina]|uniref:taste receptor type 2 member 40-like n=1 Tax=Bombina bombina TaxID=8345 RepID=UPI00235AF215|nr:taste receptor type 2 member 40-like [Bombina bombina]